MSFYTKSVERILSPVAQQVLKLILLFEDADTGAEIPDLELRVNAVKLAVDNLIKVGQETISASDDEILNRDMPTSLKRVEIASGYLQEAVVLLHQNSKSSEARKKLIEGSRGILQGTSSVLLTFDMSEVRKIVGHCQRVLAVLSTTEAVLNLPGLADFVKRLTPCMAHMIKEVDNRQEELTIQSHAALLRRGIEQVKRLTPILISSMKLFVNTHKNGLPGAAESQANRDFLLFEMSSEIQEIIRGLQLVTISSAELFDDDLVAVNVDKTSFTSRLQFATNWITNPFVSCGAAGEKALHQLLESARRLARTNSSERDGKPVMELCDQIEKLATQLAHLGKLVPTDNNYEAYRVGLLCSQKLSQLAKLCGDFTHREDHHNALFRLARTLEGKLIQAQRWLADPRGPLHQVGLEACCSLVQDVRCIVSGNTSSSIANGLKESTDSYLESCEHIEQWANELFSLCTQPITSDIQTKQHGLAVVISENLAHVWHSVMQILIDQVTETYTDLVGPLRKLIESACPASGDLPSENDYSDKMVQFLSQCRQLANTAELAALISIPDAGKADILRYLVNQLNELGAQVVLSGRAVVLSSDNNLFNRPGGATHRQATIDHFTLMHKHWTDTAERMRDLVDEAIDANAFIKAQENGILRDSQRTEASIEQRSTTGVVEATTSIARRANRVLQLATKEADNSEDNPYVDRVNDAVKVLRSTITPMVNDAKNLVTCISNPQMHEQWRASNRNLLTAVGNIKQAVGPSTMPTNFYHDHQHHLFSRPSSSQALGKVPLEEMRDLVLKDHADTPRTATPDTEVEEEFDYPPPEENQPIMAAAHALHQEARLWSSRDNELIAATKRMAALMAQLSQIVRGEYGTKKDLIQVSMAIAEASVDVNQCAKILAKECTDRRIRSNLLHLSDRILTIGNQLKILSTVKATMLGTQNDSLLEIPMQSELDCGSIEDQENTESLVGNAQNLMQTVIETLHIAEGASIKMRVHNGFKIIWRPRLGLTKPVNRLSIN